MRLRSLDEEYSEDNIRAAIASQVIRKKVRKPIAQKQFNLLIDIQEKMAESKSAGYERWAKKYNRKEAA